MLEFKRSRRDGELYLTEVNPKFFGVSGPEHLRRRRLSLVAVHFPWLLYKLLGGEGPPIAPGGLRDGVVFPWLTMDLAVADDGPGLFGGGSAPADLCARLIDKRIEDDFDPGNVLPNVFLFARGMPRVVTSMR